MKLLGIEAARGIAALMVVFYHTARHMKSNIGYLPFNGVTQFGHAGVDFFFVLSGFIILFAHHNDVGEPKSVLRYLERRFVRIFPLYWFVICLTLLLGALFAKGGAPDFVFILHSATLLPTYAEPYVGVAWSLQHELLFYALAAVALLNRRMGVGVFAAWLVLIGAKAAFNFTPSDSALYAKLASPYNIEFFMGMLAAWAVLEDRKGRDPQSAYTVQGTGWGKFLRRQVPLFTGCIAFASFGIAENLEYFNGYEPPARLAYGLSSMLLVIGLTRIQCRSGAVGALLTQLGSASYAIYLTHFIFIGIAFKLLEISGLFFRLPVAVVYGLLTASGIIGGIVISRTVEFPLMNFVQATLFKKAPVGAKNSPVSKSSR